MKRLKVKKTNDDKVEWPEVMYVPDYSLLVSNELVDAVPLSPPDGRYLFFNKFDFDIDETFNKDK